LQCSHAEKVKSEILFVINHGIQCLGMCLDERDKIAIKLILVSVQGVHNVLNASGKRWSALFLDTQGFQTTSKVIIVRVGRPRRGGFRRQK